MDLLDLWLHGARIALSPENILWLLIGSVVGLFVGVLPAIGAGSAVAVMLPITFGLDPVTGVIFLVAIHATANYGDSIASILINVPGGVGTVATCWDGFPLARRGHGGRAIGIATVGSFLGGFLSWLVLIAIAGPITMFAMGFGAPEYCSLGIMALMLVGIASKGDILKGMITACLGLILSFVGQDPVSGVVERFTFEVSALMAGISAVAACLGMFAISEMIRISEEGSEQIAKGGILFSDSVLSGFADVVRRPITVIRAFVVGFFIGILPALGTSLAGISAYLTEKSFSKEHASFGQGNPAGLLAAEVGKGSCVVGDLIPTFTLGIPGSVTCAMHMVALTIHGITPGPQFMSAGAMPYAVFTGIVLAQGVCIVSGLGLARWFSHVLYVPTPLVVSIVMSLCFVGAFSANGSFHDIVLMLGVGVLTYGLRRINYPVVCLILGLILGPLVESNFHKSLIIEYGSWMVFLHRPTTITILALTVLFVLFPYYEPFLRRLSRRLVTAEEPENSAASGEDSPVGARPRKGELVFLVSILAGGLILVWDASNYSPLARLFPNYTIMAMLAAAAWRLAILGHGISRTGFRVSAGEGGRGESTAGIFWYWSVAGFIAYLLLTWIVGMIVASALYILVLPWIMGYRRWRVILGVAAGNTLFLIFLTKAFGMFLVRGVLF